MATRVSSVFTLTPIAMSNMKRLVIVTVLLGAACSETREHAAIEAGRLEIEAILQSQREAHLDLDADRLVESIGESLFNVVEGRVTVQSREEVRLGFTSYFEGAVYHAWEDIEPPVIQVSSDGAMAWVVRRVRADREEPDGAGGRRRRELISAYTSTFEKVNGEWRMTSVTSTFAPALPQR
jgi:hypothetical protein